jgi:hypothetical protein
LLIWQLASCKLPFGHISNMQHENEMTLALAWTWDVKINLTPGSDSDSAVVALS